MEEFADSWSAGVVWGYEKAGSFGVGDGGGFGCCLRFFGTCGLRSRKPSIFVTDDIEEALILADRAILLAECKLVNDMAVTLPRPRDEAVRASAEPVGVFKILAHLGITEEEGTTV